MENFENKFLDNFKNKFLKSAINWVQNDNFFAVLKQSLKVSRKEEDRPKKASGVYNCPREREGMSRKYVKGRPGMYILGMRLAGC
jgi:hypothetical protein